MSLSVKAARGGVVMMSGQIVKVALQFGSLIILARLLQPEDFGLVAMVIAIYGICDILLDFGLSTASIQVQNITKAQISNLFWVNVLIGLLFTLISYFSASLLASFYAQPELTKIAQYVSVVFLFNGIAAQYKAQLNRNFKFKQMAITDTTAVLLSVCIGVYFAYAGHSYWAIVYQQIAQALIQMLLYMLFGAWLPSLPSRHVSIRHFFKFGWGLAGSQLMGYFSRNIPAILIGNQIGASQLGFYDRANKLLMLPLNQLNAPSSSVAVPVLSRLAVEDQEKYNRFLLFGQNIIVHLVVFCLALTCCQTERLVQLVLGTQWLEMVPVYRALSFAGIFLALSYASYWVFLSKGITASLFKLGLVSRPISILIICLGLPAGVIGVAYAYSASLLFTWLLGVFWLRKTGVPVKSMIVDPLIMSAIYYSASFIANYVVDHYVDFAIYNILVGWLLMLLILAVFYLLVPKFKRSVKKLFEVKSYIRNKQ
ncbi:lipopolysaccharide biosynthesis protein [Methylobacillus glycogenes]|uniref:lipopolysaccharide biosynthesis protein n=1 Tax=Methylobacillus glycogenes TaxID=406 RepID=UPI0011DCE5B3|nr:lipopolysaccharide biosynthesis protein [Methylobacillus glycogenes]